MLSHGLPTHHTRPDRHTCKQGKRSTLQNTSGWFRGGNEWVRTTLLHNSRNDPYPCICPSQDTFQNLKPSHLPPRVDVTRNLFLKHSTRVSTRPEAPPCPFTPVKMDLSPPPTDPTIRTLVRKSLLTLKRLLGPLPFRCPVTSDARRSVHGR